MKHNTIEAKKVLELVRDVSSDYEICGELDKDEVLNFAIETLTIDELLEQYAIEDILKHLLKGYNKEELLGIMEKL